MILFKMPGGYCRNLHVDLKIHMELQWTQNTVQRKEQ